MRPVSTIITISIDINDECCVCLNDEIESVDIKTVCCNKIIHKECLFQILIYGHRFCPLCRRKIQLKKYFTRNEFINYLRNLSLYEKYANTYHIQDILYELTSVSYDKQNTNIIYDYIYKLIHIFYLMYSYILFYLPILFIIFIFLFFFISLITYTRENMDNEKINDFNKNTLLPILDINYM